MTRGMAQKAGSGAAGRGETRAGAAGRGWAGRDGAGRKLDQVGQGLAGPDLARAASTAWRCRVKFRVFRGFGKKLWAGGGLGKKWQNAGEKIQ